MSLLLRVLLVAQLLLWLAFSFLSTRYAGLPLVTFGLIIVGLFIVWVGVFCVLKTAPMTARQVMLFSLLLHGIAFLSYPVLEDDHFRYLWDGYVTLTTLQPYLSPPSAFFMANNLPDSANQLLNAISYPEISTVYGPVCQAIFAFGYWIAGSDVTGIKFITIISNLICIVVLSRYCSARNLFLYACNPLILHSFAQNGHIEIVSLMFLALALYCWNNKRFSLGSVLLAFAFASKVTVIVFIPFVLLLSLRYWGVFFVTLLLIYLPFISQDLLNNEYMNLLTVGGYWQFNSLFYSVVLPSLGQEKGRLVLASVMIFLYASYFFYCYGKRQGAARDSATLAFNGAGIAALMLLFSPVVNPWYLCWLLFFSVRSPYLSAWMASFAVFFSYCSGINLSGNSLGLYEIPMVVIFAEYGVVLLVFLLFDRKAALKPSLNN